MFGLNLECIVELFYYCMFIGGLIVVKGGYFDYKWVKIDRDGLISSGKWWRVQIGRLLIFQVNECLFYEIESLSNNIENKIK